MADWSTIALSGGSACLGGGLTMLGQFLTDRRSHRRDREARREEFQIANFEIQRTALLDLQEVATQLSESVKAACLRNKHDGLLKSLPLETARVTEWYQLDELLPVLKGLLTEYSELQSEASQADALPTGRRQEIAIRASELADKASETMRQFKNAEEYMSELIGKMGRIKILSARTGDDEVVTHCQDLARLIDDWTDAKDAKESELRMKTVEEKAGQALDAISHALRFGPFAHEEG